MTTIRYHHKEPKGIYTTVMERICHDSSFPPHQPSQEKKAPTVHTHTAERSQVPPLRHGRRRYTSQKCYDVVAIAFRQSNSPRAICRHGLLLLSRVGEYLQNIPENEIFRILYTDNNMSTSYILSIIRLF